MSTGDPYGVGGHAEVAQRRQRAIELKNRGLTWYQVAQEMNYLDTQGNPSPALACGDVGRALKIANKGIATGLEVYRELASSRIDAIRRQVYAVIARPHYLYSNGKAVLDEDGNKIRDDAPVLAAVDRLIRLEERQAKLEGTDASEKLTIALDRRVEEEATMTVEAILAGFNELGDALPPAMRQRALEAASAHLRTIEGEVVSAGTDDTGDPE